MLPAEHPHAELMATFPPTAKPGQWLPRIANRAAGLLRALAIGVAVCVAVAVFFSIAFDEPFARVLVFSLCIGLSCQLLIVGGRRLAARWLSRRQPPRPGAAKQLSR